MKTDDLTQLTDPQIVVTIAEGLIDKIHNLGPKDLKAAIQLLETQGNDFAIHAAKRRLYRDLATLLRREI